MPCVVLPLYLPYKLPAIVWRKQCHLPTKACLPAGNATIPKACCFVDDTLTCPCHLHQWPHACSCGIQHIYLYAPSAHICAMHGFFALHIICVSSIYSSSSDHCIPGINISFLLRRGSIVMIVEFYWNSGGSGVMMPFVPSSQTFCFPIQIFLLHYPKRYFQDILNQTPPFLNFFFFPFIFLHAFLLPIPYFFFLT